MGAKCSFDGAVTRLGVRLELLGGPRGGAGRGRLRPVRRRSVFSDRTNARVSVKGETDSAING